MCIHSTLKFHHKELLTEDTCYYCVHLETTITKREFPTETNTPLPNDWKGCSRPIVFFNNEPCGTVGKKFGIQLCSMCRELIPSRSVPAVVDASQTTQPPLVTQKTLDRELARLDKELMELRKEYERKKKTADEKHLQHFEWEQKRYDEAMTERYTEGGQPLAWHFAIPVERPSEEVFKLFHKNPAWWPWLQKTYDFVFPERKDTQEAKEAATRNLIAQHRAIWDSIALGKTTTQPKPKLIPFLHTIYSAPKRTTRDGETWDYVPWKGNSRFSDLASAEDRTQCYPADLKPDSPSVFQCLRSFPIAACCDDPEHKHGWNEYQDGVVFSTNYYKWLSTAVADQRPEGFGHKFFGIPAKTGLTFDASTKTFYLQRALRDGEAATGARLPLFSLLKLQEAAEKTKGKREEEKKEDGEAEALLRLWQEVEARAKDKNEEEEAREEYLRIFHKTEYKWTPTTAVKQLHASDNFLDQFRDFAVEFCVKKGKEKGEEKNFGKWVAREYALRSLRPKNKNKALVHSVPLNA
jgi:hypothetical protein